MPGKYLEYIKAGRYVVPVELSFLPSSIPSKDKPHSDDPLMLGELEVKTSKWMERGHWKEIKTLLKPALEMVGKYNEAPMDKISKSAHFGFGHEIALGYMIVLNKDKCPFVAILDSKRHYWTDDEEDTETDENSGIADFGGRHKSFTPTRCYIKGIVVRKPGRDMTDEEKKPIKKEIWKELGVKSDDITNYLEPCPTSGSGPTTSNLSNINRVASNPPGPGMTVLDKPQRVRVGSKKKESRPKRRTDRRERSRSITNNTHLHRIRDYSSSEESLMDLPPPGCPTSWPVVSTGGNDSHRLRPDIGGSRLRVHRPVVVPRPQRSPGVDCNDSETDVLPIDDNLDDDDEASGRGGILSDSVDDVFSSSSLFRNWIEDDDEDFDEELPDIEETSLHTSRKGNKRSGGSRKKYPGDKSPAKNNLVFGLPDIDQEKRGGRTKKKRNVAIVEPMKPMKSCSSGQISFEEAIGATNASVLNPNERRKRVRSNASPTIERLLSSRSKITNSAIEILGADEELPNSDSRSQASQSSVEKKKRKASPRRPRIRRNKIRSTSFNDRLTPSPFPESPEEENLNEDDDADNFASQESNSGSETDPEMPVLVKMVPTPENAQQNLSDAITPPDSPDAVVPPLEPETNALGTVDDNRPERSIVKPRRSPSPDIVDCTFSIIATSSSLVKNNSQQVLHSQRFPSPAIRKRHASDSDDITSESAYRKTPLLRRKRRKRLMARPSSAFSSTDASDQFTFTSSQSLQPFRGILSPNKPTGDAQTQTFAEIEMMAVDPLSSLQSHPSSNNDALIETFLLADINIFLPVPPAVNAPVKTERCDHTQSEESDNDAANKESDDDEVLFAGQYQAIPVLTIDSPRHGGEADTDDDEEELFSFERPASVKIEPQQSINSFEFEANTDDALQNVAQEVVVETTPTEEDEEYSFDFVARARKYHAASKAGGPRGSASILNALSDKPNPTEVIRPSDSPPEHRSQPRLHDEDESHSQPENLSTFQLMNHPGTLRAGFGFLNKVMSNNANSDDIYKQFVGMDKRGDKKRNGEQNKQQKNKDCDLMPPPPAKRPVSPDICSLNPEEQRRKARSKKDKNLDKGQERNPNRAGSPVPSTSTGIRASYQSSRRPFRVDSSDDSEGDGYDDHYPKGAEPYFREFMSRTQEPDKEYQPRGDEYDLTQASQCMISVVQDYAEKSRAFKKHTKNIENMTSDQFKQLFGTIKPEILRIFEGTESSTRNQLYCNKSHQDIRTLKTLNVIRPFHEEHGNTLNAWLYDLLLPYSGSTLKCADYINYVMRPEAFIRIYACVNDISCETAEKEMLAGPCYEGPCLDS